MQCSSPVRHNGYKKHRFPKLGKSGEGELVLMSIEAYQYREEMLDLREKLLSAEANRLSGAKTYTIAEVSERLRELIDGNL